MASTLKYYTGSVWTAKPLKYWTGSAWATKQLKYWDGAAWIGAAASGATFNPADKKDSSVVLSNGNRTVTMTGSSNPYWVRSTTSKAAGKYYVEYTAGTIAGQGLGIADSSAITFLGQNAKSFGNSPTGFIALNNTYQDWLTPYVSGDVVGMAVDFDNKLLWYRKNGGNWNGNAGNSPSTGSGGYPLTAYTGTPHFVAVSGDQNAVATVNFGASAFGATAPAGYVSWDATAYQDSFNRANANLEASLAASGGWSWTHDGVIAAGFTIASNALKSNTALTTGSAYKTPALASADHYVQYKVTNITAATGPFACCRLADANNFIGIRTGNGGSNGQIEVYRRVGGTLSSLYTSAASAVAVNDIVRLTVSGSNFTVTKNGGAVTGPTAIGATLTATNAGLLARSSTTMTFEDFEAG